MKRVVFRPKWNDPCLCGSGKKHRDCCWGRLPGFGIGKAYSNAVKDQHWERALLACRADITQYTVWHRTNTKPMLSRGIPGLLRIDINALAAYVDRLLWLYVHTDRLQDWLAVTERLRGNIEHIRWFRKIAYFRALSYLGPNSDRAKARQELDKIKITTDEDDVELLQIYIDLESQNQPFSIRLAYLDRILAVSDDLSDQLQYRGAKAVQYFLVGDLATAEQVLADAVNLARNADNLEDFERDKLGKILQLLGSINDNHELLEEAIDHFTNLLLRDKWTDEGRASLLREIGDCHKFANAWDSAEKAYRDALSAYENVLDRIHLAETLLYQKEIEAAVVEIDKLDRASLQGSEFEDFVFAFAAIAIWSENQDRLQDARKLLEGLRTSEPYFTERRLKLLLSVTNTLAEGRASLESKAQSTPERGVTSTISDFIMLQPNIMGIGININAMINYFLTRKQRK